MAYVVTQACMGNKHTSCVDVCPVEAFREGPEMLFIDPEACIECNACVSACPEQAIYPGGDVPEDQRHFIALNAEKARVHPVIRESIKRAARDHAHADLEGRFAVVGSGPSGFYAAEALLREMPQARVDIFERLPTPFGLVRYGVAPDHPRIKSVSAGFERIAESPRVRFFGNVAIGRDLQRDDLLGHYHGVVYATGGSRSRGLEIPGADGPNIFGSSEFVGWYNGHPDHQALPVDLSGSCAVIAGIGNVALDIARILALPTERLARTDIADHALSALRSSNVTDIYLLARRGPAEAAFTPKELEQLMATPGVDIVVDPDALVLEPASEAALADPGATEARRNLELLREIAGRERTGGRRVHLVFRASPARIDAAENGPKSVAVTRNALEADDRGRVAARPTGETFDLTAGLIVHATGYRGEVLADLPFDDRRGIIPNADGRVNTASGEVPREYVTGWIKRGASGVIGSNRQCAGDTVQSLLDDLPDDVSSIEADIESVLTARGVKFTTFEDWRLLDAHEQARGLREGRPRRKLTDVPAMLAAIREERAEAECEARQPVKTHYRSCTLCEAMCGLKIEYQGRRIVSIAGDEQDPHSQGHICPKGYALQDIHNDPDRLTTPMEKVGGQWLPIDWDAALDKVARRLADIQAQHGADAVGGYWGNPASHNMGLMFGAGMFRRALGSRNMFTAASLDQMPHQLLSYLMLGNGQMISIPDIDRTDYMLMLGANPAASNGSLMTAGDILKRLEAIRQRGGKLVLLDPRRTESARYVCEHHFIRPATDALFLIGLIRHIIDNRLYKPERLLEFMDDWEGLLGLFDGFSPAELSAGCGVPEAEIVRIAEEFATAKRAVCYGRMGISTQAYGALNHWLIAVLNMITGNFDRAGGMMFTTPAFDKAVNRPSGSFGTYGSRVRGLPEFNRQLPSAVMAEEMLTPGEGQIRAFVSIAGNPVLSAPNGRAIDAGMAGLDFMVSVDFYLNETTRHADIILPPTGPLEHEQYDIVFNLLAVRNVARFAEPLFEPPAGTRSDWEIMTGLARRIAALKDPDKAGKGDGDTTTPETILDHALRTGPYGEGFTEYNGGEPVHRDEGLSLSVLKRYIHGLDLGPMQPNLPRYLHTSDGRIHTAPPVLVADLERLRADLEPAGSGDTLMLIGRRDLRSNNSWMHNSERLVKGEDRCALFVHPDDAAGHGLRDGGRARLESRVGGLEVDVRVTDDVMAGVVSLPHGWGHHREGTSLRVAETAPGVSLNDITDDQRVDSLSGNAVLNGVPVRLAPLPEAAAATA